MKFYAGIGARDTPIEIQDQMTMAATQLSYHDLVLRSGAAQGADQAFERGAEPGKTQIFLPWPNYNQHPSQLCNPLEEAMQIAAHCHPAWGACNQGVRKLMARNVHIILGPDLNSPVLFVLCWTKGGQVRGGTGHSLRVAEAFGIPVFNMGALSLEEIGDRISKFIT